VAVGALLFSRSAACVHLPEIPKWNPLNRKHSSPFQLISSNLWGFKPYSPCVPRFTYPPSSIAGSVSGRPHVVNVASCGQWLSIPHTAIPAKEPGAERPRDSRRAAARARTARAVTSPLRRPAPRPLGHRADRPTARRSWHPPTPPRGQRRAPSALARRPPAGAAQRVCSGVARQRATRRRAASAPVRPLAARPTAVQAHWRPSRPSRQGPGARRLRQSHRRCGGAAAVKGARTAAPGHPHRPRWGGAAAGGCGRRACPTPKSTVRPCCRRGRRSGRRYSFHPPPPLCGGHGDSGAPMGPPPLRFSW